MEEQLAELSDSETTYSALERLSARPARAGRDALVAGILMFCFSRQAVERAEGFGFWRDEFHLVHEIRNMGERQLLVFCSRSR